VPPHSSEGLQIAQNETSQWEVLSFLNMRHNTGPNQASALDFKHFFLWPEIVVPALHGKMYCPDIKSTSATKD
jgi:hypothetical protein